MTDFAKGLLFGSTLLLAGCGATERLGDMFRSIGQDTEFRTSLSKGEDRRDISVRVRAGGVSVVDVRESVRFEATRYCLRNFGNSDIRWAIDGATGDWAFERDGEAMIFSGRCLAR